MRRRHRIGCREWQSSSCAPAAAFTWSLQRRLGLLQHHICTIIDLFGTLQQQQMKVKARKRKAEAADSLHGDGHSMKVSKVRAPAAAAAAACLFMQQHAGTLCDPHTHASCRHWTAVQTAHHSKCVISSLGSVCACADTQAAVGSSCAG